MRHDMSGAGLPRERKIFARQHMAIQTEAKLHSGSIEVIRVCSHTFVCYAHWLQVGSAFSENSPCNSDYFSFRGLVLTEILRGDDMIGAGTTDSPTIFP